MTPDTRPGEPRPLTVAEEAEVRAVAATFPDASLDGPTTTLLYGTVRRLLATLDEARAGSLDAAWQEAEAALPEHILQNAAANPDEEWGKPDDYTLAVESGRGGSTAWVRDPSTDDADPMFALVSAAGDTPAAALRALAAALREAQP